jgi:hypothetical protein
VQQSESTDAEGKTTQTFATELNLTPEYTPDTPDDAPSEPTDAQRAQYLVFLPLDVRLSATFASGQAKNAATSLDAQLTLSGDAMPQTYTLALAGKTRGKWVPDAFDAASATNLDAMNADTLQALLLQAGVRGGLLLLPYLSLPAVTPAPAATPASVG